MNDHSSGNTVCSASANQSSLRAIGPLLTGRPAMALGVAFGLFLSAAQLSAFQSPERPMLPNFDKRPTQTAPAAAASAEQRAAESQLRARLPQLQVDYDPVTGSAKLVMASDGLLTGAQGVGRAVTPSLAAGLAADDPYRATKAFLSEHSALFGYGAEVLNAAIVKQEYVTAHNGMRTVVWEQQLAGVPLFEAVLISHTTARGELVNVCSQFIPNPQAAAENGGADGSDRPAYSASKAVGVAARNVGEKVEDQEIAPDPSSPNAASDLTQRQLFIGTGIKGSAECKLVWLPTSKSTLKLCWEVVFTSRSRDEMFMVLVDARSGEPLVRHCLTAYLTDITFRVHTNDSPAPLLPGWSTPMSNQPPFVSRVLVTFPALDTNASPAGWINDGGNETLGNNVDAHTDRTGNNIIDLPRPQGSPARVFDFAMDPTTQDPTNYSAAAIVETFYLCNFMHDKLYQLGFTEAAGNFQSNNFGRGGAASDALIADAQDGGGFNNANMSTPADGSPPRMQMYIFNSPTPRRDGDFDAGVVLHEYTHGLSNRRVGGGVLISALQTAGMGEGWSDFYALCMLSQPGMDVNGNYPEGAHASYLLAGPTENTNYYFGIRRYPYTTDLTKNPLTFRDIDPAQTHYCSSSAPFNSPQFGSCSSSTANASEVHNQGEVWCVTLWEARARLINRYGFAVGNHLILQLVTDGMGLSPANPTFVQARNAIIQADQVDTGGANAGDLWAAFAKRGMGFSATAPNNTTTTGVMEAYDIPDDLRISPLAGFVGNGPVGGPFTPNSQIFTVTNAGSNSLNWTLIKTSAWINATPASGTLTPGGPATSITVSLTPSATNLPMGVYPTTMWFTNLNNQVAQSRSFTLRVGQPDFYTEQFSSATNDLAFKTLTFTPDGSASFYSVCVQPAAAFLTDPTGGTTLTLMDDNSLQITITGGNTVGIYNTRTNVLFVGSNGYLTMNSGDSANDQSFATHFNRPRVSALFRDLNPAAGGTVSWKQLSDRIAVTFNAVPNYGVSLLNSFQFELFFDGRIRLTYLSLGATDGLAGLSAGSGVPANFQASDLDTYGGCAPLQLLLPSTAAENAGTLSGAGSLLLGGVLGTNLTVALTSSAPARLTVPASATILAGQVSASFNLTAVDNNLQDGNQLVTVGASAPGFTNVAASILIVDDDTPPVIQTQPASQTISVGGNVTFSVTATGKLPLTYAWRRGGVAISGATNSSYSTNNVQLPDSGSLFSCLLSNQYGTLLSSTATLTVVTAPTDWFTELFDSSISSMANKSFTFTPNNGANFYSVCSSAVISFPTDPTGGTALTLTDDSFSQITLTNSVAIYNNHNNVIFVGSNGYLTMNSGDTTFTPSYTNHFALPRVSALYRDLNPSAGGTVSWKQLTNRVAITYQGVPIFGDSTQTNNFQVELFYDGRIRISYLSLNTPTGLVGLSAGAGQPAGFVPSDYTTYGPCGNQAPLIAVQPANVTSTVGGSATFRVTAFGSPPLSYFWKRNGSLIIGANTSTYTTNNVQLPDSGSQFSCLVSNAFGTAISSNASLTVGTFQTDWFAELFGTLITNLSYHSFTFTPNGGPNFYTVCSTIVTDFPTDPSNGTVLNEADDTYDTVTLSGGTVAIYNNSSSVLYVGSNGYLTMNTPDTSYSPSYATHFQYPRVSALFRDLDATTLGIISSLELADRVAITYQGVPIYGSTTLINDFQIELFFDGRIRITYLGITAPTGLVGLSAGAGTPPNFVASDFTTYPICQPVPLSFSSIQASGGSLIASGIGGTPGAGYSVLASSNLSVPSSNWMGISTGLFDGSGNFSFTNTLDPTVRLQFYRIRVP